VKQPDQALECHHHDFEKLAIVNQHLEEEH
jgi:hypothetical protein